MKNYHFNRFAIVTQVDDKIFVNASPEIRATFELRHKAIVEFFTKTETFSQEQALRLLAPARLAELVEKRIFLSEPIDDLDGRYSRQLGYFSITSADSRSTHERHRNAHVLVLGAGAIGSHVCWNLAAIGVGKISVLDFDVVEASNLNRQLMYTPNDIGQHKVEVLGKRIAEFNPTVQLHAINRKLACEQDVLDLIDGLGRIDVLVKAIDSPEDSMDFVNKVCLTRGIAYVTGGFMDYVGVVGPNFIPGRSTCFACHRNSENVQRLHGTGPTFAPLTTLVAAMVAMVAHKILIEDHASVANKVFSYNTVTATWDTETAVASKTCPVCGTAPPPPAPAADMQRTNIATFRLSLVALMTLTLVLRQMFDQRLVGVLTFAMLFLSIPVLYGLCGRNAQKTRREFFVTACIYIMFSILAVVSDAATVGTIALPKTLDATFVALRALVGLIGQAVVGITALFFLLCGALEYVPRFIELLNSNITESEDNAT